MLYVYGTVYNNAKRVKESIDSVKKINVDKKIFIIDNYSTDGTYEILLSIPNITVKREKCTRGKGRQLAMEMAEKEATDDDFFMSFDLDTIYNDNFARLIEWAVKKIGSNDVVFFSFLCKKQTNFKIPWRDINNGEDWERSAHFCSLNYNLLTVNKIHLDENEHIESNSREKRYERGIRYYKRQFKNTIDLFRGWGINDFKKLKKYLDFIKTRVNNKKKLILLYISLFLIFIYVKLFIKEIYSYSKDLNNFFVRSKMKNIDEIIEDIL